MRARGTPAEGRDRREGRYGSLLIAYVDLDMPGAFPNEVPTPAVASAASVEDRED